MITKKRYLTIEGSQSCHCCFRWTIVDTYQPKIYHKWPSVCECYEHEDARRIEHALNLAYDTNAEK
jgi:hypothetical protein